MTKLSKLVADVVISATVAPAAPAVVSHAQPSVIVITEPTAKAFAAAASLIRTGWVIDTNTAPEVFASTGHSTITLIRGNPDSTAVAIAEAAEAYAAARHAIDFEVEVNLAATRMLEAKEKAAKQAEIAAITAAQKAQIAKLTAEMNAIAQ